MNMLHNFRLEQEQGRIHQKYAQYEGYFLYNTYTHKAIRAQ